MGYTNKYLYTVISIIILSVSSASAQIGLSEETRKSLLKSANPMNDPMKNFMTQPLESDKTTDNKYLDAYNQYRLSTKVDLTLEEYKINSHVFTYKSDIPANQLPVYASQVVYMGGHFVIVPTGGGLVTPSGISLTGWSPKILSEKSKAILKYVYGMEIEE